MLLGRAVNALGKGAIKMGEVSDATNLWGPLGAACQDGSASAISAGLHANLPPLHSRAQGVSQLQDLAARAGDPPANKPDGSPSAPAGSTPSAATGWQAAPAPTHVLTLSCFQDELSALAYLEGVLWPDGPVCPRCQTRGRIGRLDGLSTRIGTFKCYACRRNFSITRGTLFNSSHVPLHKWLQAIYLTGASPDPMRPSHLARIIGVSFKTACRMMKALEDAKMAETSKQSDDWKSPGAAAIELG